jgi:hypothetical protein
VQAKLGIFLAAEHFMFALRMTIEWLIPDIRKSQITRLYKEKEKLEWLHRVIKYKGYNGEWKWVVDSNNPPPSDGVDPYQLQKEWRQHTPGDGSRPESAAGWIWKFSGEYGLELNDVCDKTNPVKFVPPGRQPRVFLF